MEQIDISRLFDFGRADRSSHVMDIHNYALEIQSKSVDHVEEISFEPTELKTLLSEAPFQFFVFNQVVQQPYDSDFTPPPRHFSLQLQHVVPCHRSRLPRHFPEAVSRLLLPLLQNMQIKIHTDKRLDFLYLAPYEENIESVRISVFNRENLSKEIALKCSELDFMFAEMGIQFFYFGCLEQNALFTTQSEPLYDYIPIIEAMATVATKKLILNGPIATIPTFSHSIDWIYIMHAKALHVAPAFDLAQKHKELTLDFECEDSNVVSSCCEYIQKIMEGTVVAKRIVVYFEGNVRRPEVLERFLEEKGSETVAIAEGFEFRLIPVSQGSFVAVHWYSYEDQFNLWHVYFDVGLISNSKTFFERVYELYSWHDCPGDRLSAEEVRQLPVVQEICNRFYA